MPMGRPSLPNLPFMVTSLSLHTSTLVHLALDQAVHLAQVLDVAHAGGGAVLDEGVEEGHLVGVALACQAQPHEGGAVQARRDQQVAEHRAGTGVALGQGQAGRLVQQGVVAGDAHQLLKKRCHIYSGLVKFRSVFRQGPGLWSGLVKFRSVF